MRQHGPDAGSSDLDPDLRRLLAAIQILSPTRYLKDERPRIVDVEATADEGPMSALTAALERELYEWFLRRREASTESADPAAERWHLAALSLAHRGRGTWDPGWRLRGVEEDGTVAVERHGVVFRAAAEEVRCAAPGAVAGEPCRVWVPAEMRGLLPGFVLFRGDTDKAEPAAIPWRVRCYWNLRSATAVRWLGTLTSDLDRLEVPFSLKVLRDPRTYRRADAGVLYLEPRHYGRALPAIRRCYRKVRDGMRPEVPRLTVELAPGLGVAEGPADGDSFGEHRCRLIAGALTRAFAAGRHGERERPAVVASAFRAAGLDPRRPHLAPGSSASYRPLDELR